MPSDVMNGFMLELRNSIQIFTQRHVFHTFLHPSVYTQTYPRAHTQTCHSSSSLMNQTIRHKVACKQRQLAQCVVLNGWLICLGSPGNEGRTYCHILPLSDLLASLRLIGIQMVWFISHRSRGARGERRQVCVFCACVWDEG